MFATMARFAAQAEGFRFGGLPRGLSSPPDGARDTERGAIDGVAETTIASGALDPLPLLVGCNGGLRDTDRAATGTA